MRTYAAQLQIPPNMGIALKKFLFLLANVNFYQKHLQVQLKDNYEIYNKDTVSRLINIYNS